MDKVRKKRNKSTDTFMLFNICIKADFTPTSSLKTGLYTHTTTIKYTVISP